MPFVTTFGEVARGKPLCYRDGGASKNSARPRVLNFAWSTPLRNFHRILPCRQRGVVIAVVNHCHAALPGLPRRHMIGDTQAEER